MDYSNKKMSIGDAVNAFAMAGFGRLDHFGSENNDIVAGYWTPKEVGVEHNGIHGFGINFLGGGPLNYSTDYGFAGPLPQRAVNEDVVLSTGGPSRLGPMPEQKSAFTMLLPMQVMADAFETVLLKDFDPDARQPAYVGAPTPTLRSLLRLIRDEHKDQRRSNVAMIDALSKAISIEVARGLSAIYLKQSVMGSLSEAESSKVMTMLDLAIDGTLQVGDIANELKLEPYQLTRRFKAKYGCTPKEYLSEIRLKMASELLSNADIAIADIAYQCGYSSQAHFTTIFKAAKGTTPNLYRTSLLNQR